jgi:hypothetical protein
MHVCDSMCAFACIYEPTSTHLVCHHDQLLTPDFTQVLHNLGVPFVAGRHEACDLQTLAVRPPTCAASSLRVALFALLVKQHTPATEPKASVWCACECCMHYMSLGAPTGTKLKIFVSKYVGTSICVCVRTHKNDYMSKYSFIHYTYVHMHAHSPCVTLVHVYARVFIPVLNLILIPGHDHTLKFKYPCVYIQHHAFELTKCIYIHAKNSVIYSSTQTCKWIQVFIFLCIYVHISFILICICICIYIYEISDKQTQKNIHIPAYKYKCNSSYDIYTYAWHVSCECFMRCRSMHVLVHTRYCAHAWCIPACSLRAFLHA